MAVDWENLPSTNTPLNATNLKSALNWTRIANYQTASSNTTVMVDDITNYSDFLMALTPEGEPARVLNSATIPKEMFLINLDAGNGLHQIIGIDNRGCGLSYRGNNQLKLYTKANSGIVVYAR